MIKAVKTHVSNLAGKQRLYDVTLSRFCQMNQKAVDDEGHNWFGFESGREWWEIQTKSTSRKG